LCVCRCRIAPAAHSSFLFFLVSALSTFFVKFRLLSIKISFLSFSFSFC
jgi:hypothetical protein